MDVTAERFDFVTFELREHSDGKWDFCICSDGEKVHKLSRITLQQALSQLEKMMALREKIIKENL